MYIEESSSGKYAIHSLSKEDLHIIAEALETACAFKYSCDESAKRIKAERINSAIKNELKTTK